MSKENVDRATLNQGNRAPLPPARPRPTKQDEEQTMQQQHV
jgi:hypothetical protein